MSPYCSERCEVLTLYSLFFQFSSFHVTAVTFGCFEMPSGLCAAVTIGTKVLCQRTAEVLFSRQTKDPLNLSQATKSCLFFVLRATKAAEVCTAPRHYCAQMTTKITFKLGLPCKKGRCFKQRSATYMLIGSLLRMR